MKVTGFTIAGLLLLIVLVKGYVGGVFTRLWDAISGNPWPQSKAVA